MFVTEIREQPEAVRTAVRYYQGEGAALLDQVSALVARDSEGPGRVFFTGMGSSLYAVDAVLPRLAAGGIDARIVEAGEWLHYGLQRLPAGSLAVAVSQSGESIETRAVAERLSSQSPVVAVTNDPTSSMARAARVALPLQAGYEEMIAAKTSTNSMAVLHLAAAALLREDRSATLEQLDQAAGAMEQGLDAELEPAIRQAAQWLDEARSVHSVGRGPSLAAARSGALVLGEGAHLAVTALPAGSFRHGPLELAGEGHAAIVVRPSGRTSDLLDRLVSELLQAGSRVVVLSDHGFAEMPNLRVLPVAAGLEEQYFPLPAAILMERMLAAVAERRGLVPGEFRYGGKVTDRE